MPNNNILTINDSNQPINYKKAEIDNSFNYHKPANLNELFTLLKKDTDIQLIDTSSCLLLITDNDQEISLHQYTNQQIRFFKIFNKTLIETGNEIIFYAKSNHYIMPGLKWANEKIHTYGTPMIESLPHLTDTLVNDLLNDFDGYAHSIENIEKWKKLINYLPDPNHLLPAIEYCHDFIKEEGYTGYLPSVGQMKMILENKDLINRIFSLLSLKTYDFNENWWTSNDYYTAYAFVCNKATITGEYPEFIPKLNIRAVSEGGMLVYVFPLFKKITDNQ